MADSTAGSRQCEACRTTADDLVQHDGMWFCPSLERCDYNANIGWINADIQILIVVSLVLIGVNVVEWFA